MKWLILIIFITFDVSSNELKKKQFKERFEKLKDIYGVIAEAGLNEPNPEILKKRIIDNLDEDKLILLEQKEKAWLTKVNQEKAKEEAAKAERSNIKKMIKFLNDDTSIHENYRKILKRLIKDAYK